MCHFPYTYSLFLKPTSGKANGFFSTYNYIFINCISVGGLLTGRIPSLERGKICTESLHRSAAIYVFNRTFQLSLQLSSSKRRRVALGSYIALQLHIYSTDQTATKQPPSVATWSLGFVGSLFPNIAPQTSFHGPINTTTFRFKAGILINFQLKCCGFVQCRTYLTPPRDNNTPFKGGQTFHILAYLPHD